jgi:hypothetical protein
MQDADEQVRAAQAPQGTGVEQVDAALDRLAALDDLPLAAQVTVFDDVHRLLQDALTGSDQPPADGPAVDEPRAPGR